MPPDILRIYKTVHTWTGILTGMALFIAFYAGAITVFKEPLARWASPPMTTPVAPSLDDALPLIISTLRASPEAAREFSLHLREAEHLPGRLEWQSPAEGAESHRHDTLGMEHFVAHPGEDGAARIEAVAPSKLAEFIDVLHRVVGLPFDSDTARWIMGVIACLYALALVSGVVLLVPTLVKDLFALRPGRNLKRLWRDAHNVVGLFSLPFHLVMALTATVFAFHDDLYSLQDTVIHDGRLASVWQAPSPAPPQPGEARDPGALLPPADLLARVRALSPTFTPIRLHYTQATGPRAMVRVWGQDATALVSRPAGGFVAIDPYSGRIVNADYLPGHQSPALTTIGSFFALHFATYGGLPVKWMYFLLGLAGAWLFYSGNLLWIESRRKTQRRGEATPPRQRRDTTVMAALSVGVCLGCLSGLSLTIVAGKWLHGVVSDLTTWHQLVYYAVFFASIGWAFLRGAARASVDLLWLATLATAAIPLTSGLSWLIPPLPLWGHTSAASLGVDATAGLGALCFALMARATSRRLRSGQADSLWVIQDGESGGTASPIKPLRP
ncbi:PepSY-associated TM helix domain-containing protein [Rhodospirillum rubrum]|uniref:PepSY-associated TM helix n=2 Tax=Rhodospirillum rubrum TaxID=1085 RepID=Q2RRY0_RHORT|nr:PepSY-associated TM helix domain-containing protein [Rhodospirillum rubrum]ABC23115.1 PepSY-associated TM helix [Rhodospirillum rubrum ATCC 11170]AEO48845.1 PepSY-associated TM helix [Rhodospirillum rubrum F11]MBK5954729.1 PepSY domain-containing protein [Rhodospirillum rubrum]QXG79099.1 PepSY domain-containing protein [Rhodospirillum rubrum]HAQ01338.1 PepSY domain-containing protein [Rhodospirillum rubrum]